MSQRNCWFRNKEVAQEVGFRTKKCACEDASGDAFIRGYGASSLGYVTFSTAGFVTADNAPGLGIKPKLDSLGKRVYVAGMK